jgi:hypothetical protein
MGLENNGELLKEIVERAVDMIQVFQPVLSESGEIADFTCILNNQAARTLQGDLKGKSLSNLSSGLVDTLRNVVETGEPTRCEYYDENLKRWFRTHISKVGGPESQVIANVLEDITERKHQEQQQAYLLKLAICFAHFRIPSV